MRTRPVARPITLRKTALNSSISALALSLPALLGSSHVFAEEEAIQLDAVQVEERTEDTNPYAEAGAPYKARTSGDERRVKPIAETPSTMSVLTQTQIQDAGESDLKEILAAQPGISLGTGENGNAFGDRYVIRGNEARSDVFVDGLRDPGMTTRESFAVEQIEITKGPSGSFAGRGSAGGAVNSITKQASAEYDFTKLQAGLGTDNYQRYTVDTNQRVADDVALRANLLFADEDVPGRAPADRSREGAALAGAWQVSDRFDIKADAYYLKSEDKPDLGTYLDANNKPVKSIPVYLQDEDFLTSDVVSFTMRLGYQFSDNVRIQNASRFGTTDNGYVATGAAGATRDATDPDAPLAPTVRLSTHQGWQEVEYWVNQTNLFVDHDLARMLHQWVFTLEYSDLKVTNGVYNITNNGATNCVLPGRGANPPSGGYCIVDDAGDYISDPGSLMDRDIQKGSVDADYEIETVSLGIMDTIDLNEKWSVFLGVRADYFEYSNLVGTTSPTEWAYNDLLWNGHAGVVYNVADNGNIYLAWGTAATINGGESDVGANCGYGGLCGAVEIIKDSKPETVENIELGTKWNLMDEKLLATAALFQMTKGDIMESQAGYDYATNGFLNTGEFKVEGIELSLAGNLTGRLSTLFGVSIMDAEITESYDGNNVGKTLANFADNSAFLQLRYQLTDRFAFGGVATYSSEVYVGQPDSAANENRYVPDYTVYDMFANYELTKRFNVQLNVGNVTDEDYYFTAYRSGAFTYIGDARNAHVTLNYEF